MTQSGCRHTMLQAYNQPRKKRGGKLTSVAFFQGQEVLLWHPGTPARITMGKSPAA